MRIIDAHAHVNGDDADSLALLEKLDLELLNICVAIGDWRTTDRAPFRDLAHPNRYHWCTTFDLPDFSAPIDEYAERVIAELDDDLSDGAVAVKAWKNIGMELRRPDGGIVLIDDEIFDPILAHCAKHEIPMIMHIGEPRACWRPLSEPSPHASYYRDHPEWHMYGRADMPSHEEIIAARDRVLEKHSQLRVVGAHLGSLEHDVAEVARRFEQYPNFAVDISARLGDLLMQPAAVVGEFFTRYSDRILYGTDDVAKASLAEADAQHRLRVHESMHRSYDDSRRYLETTEVVRRGGASSPGLGLPSRVLDAVYAGNARAWYPGI